MCVSYTSRWGSIISCGWCLDARRVVVWTWGHYILCSPKEKSKWDTMGDTCPNQPGYSWLLCTTYAYYASQDLDIMYKSVCGIIWIPSLLSNIQELFHLLHVLTMKHSKTTLLYHLQLWAILHQSYEWETATTFQPGFVWTDHLKLNWFDFPSSMNGWSVWLRLIHCIPTACIQDGARRIHKGRN